MSNAHSPSSCRRIDDIVVGIKPGGRVFVANDRQSGSRAGRMVPVSTGGRRQAKPAFCPSQFRGLYFFGRRFSSRFGGDCLFTNNSTNLGNSSAMRRPSRDNSSVLYPSGDPSRDLSRGPFRGPLRGPSRGLSRGNSSMLRLSRRLPRGRSSMFCSGRAGKHQYLEGKAIGRR